jgi:hypothetical protein
MGGNLSQHRFLYVINVMQHSYSLFFRHQKQIVEGDERLVRLVRGLAFHDFVMAVYCRISDAPCKIDGLHASRDRSEHHQKQSCPRPLDAKIGKWDGLLDFFHVLLTRAADAKAYIKRI